MMQCLRTTLATREQRRWAVAVVAIILVAFFVTVQLPRVGGTLRQ
jgi:hypothetical protein